MDTRALDELRGLAARDEELAAQAEQLRGVDGEVGAIRGRAEEIEAFFFMYAGAEERLRSAAEAAAAELTERRAKLAEAERQVAAARNDEARVAAERVLARALDHVAVAETRVERATAEALALERKASELRDELPELAARAARVGYGEPGGAPRELVDWASAAHASLFVAAGQVDTQRERVIREANELATMLLGEATYGATAAQAVARVEATLR